MDHIRAGTIKPTIAVVALDDVPDAMARLLETNHVGKLVVRVDGGVDVQDQT